MEKQAMSDNHDQQAALWQCGACGAWWCSQPALAPTNFLHQLPGDLLVTLDWSDFRGWAVGPAPAVAACIECGTVASTPTYGSAAAVTRRQPMFALHAARGMTVRNMRLNGFTSSGGD
jgi:hypothetical protein